MLSYSNGGDFSVGSAPYAYLPVTERDQHNRITIEVEVGGFPTRAMIDTGGVFLICSGEMSRQINLHWGQGQATRPLLWRNLRLDGELNRVTVAIPAMVGNSVNIDATVFIPDERSLEDWPIEYPCVLGMDRCLDRLRFAIEPGPDTFYFSVV